VRIGESASCWTSCNSCFAFEGPVDAGAEDKTGNSEDGDDENGVVVKTLLQDAPAPLLVREFVELVSRQLAIATPLSTPASAAAEISVAD